MNFVRVRNILMGAGIAIVLVILFEDQLLSLLGVNASWRKVAGYVPIVAVFILLAGVFALLAWRYRPQIREQRREIAHRQGRTVGFYIGSIAALLLLYAATIVVAGYVIRDEQTARTVVTFAPLGIGLGYSFWYGWYARRSAAKYAAKDPDTFS